MHDTMSSPARVLPVRLSCRFSNGMVMSYGARAVSCEGETLRVLTSEKFEPGVALQVTSPVLARPTVYRVAKVSRSEGQAGFFLVDLRVLAPPTPKPAARRPIPEVLREAAAELAERLEAAGPQATLYGALSATTSRQAGAFVVASLAAVLALVQRKGLADTLSLVRSLEGFR